MPDQVVAMAAAGEADAVAEADDECVQVDLSTLAYLWEDDRRIRRHATRSKSLLTWIAPNKVGVVTMRTLKLNVDVMWPLVQLYVPNSRVNKTSPLDPIKAEVGCFKLKKLRPTRGNIFFLHRTAEGETFQREPRSKAGHGSGAL